MRHFRLNRCGLRHALAGIFGSVVLLGLLPSLGLANPTAYEPGLDPALGFNLISWSGSTTTTHWNSALDALSAAGFTEVSISPLRFINSDGTLSSSGTPSLTGIRNAVRHAVDDLGMTVTINPFVEPAGFTTWRGNYNPSGTTATNYWSSYETYLDQVADIAEDEGASFMTVGTEMKAMTANSAHNASWNTVINSVNGLFSGQIGYAANWDEYNHFNTTAAIWEHPNIDFLGIDAYFPMATTGQANASGTNPNPTFINLVRNNWNNLIDNQILPFAQARQGGSGLPIIFTEGGFLPYNRSVVQHGAVDTGVVDQDEQIMGFNATLQALDHRRADDNFLAWHIWQWGMTGSDGSLWNMDATLPANQPNNVPATQFLSDFVSNPSLPTEKFWTNAVSGDFGAAGNWTGGLPGSGDTATFNASGTYTVTFDNSPNPLPTPVDNDSLNVEAGNVTFRSSGTDYTYHLASDASLSGSTLSLGAASDPVHVTVDNDLTVNGGATLNVSFGSAVNTQDLRLAQSDGNGTIVVDGSGSQLNASDSTDLGQAGNTASLTYRNSAQGSLATSGTLRLAFSDTVTTGATLNVESGADLTTGNIAIGSGFSFSSATMNVQGSGSTVMQAGASTLTVGGEFSDTSQLNVGTTASGASFSTGTGLTTIHSAGVLNVGSASTEGTFDADGPILVHGTVNLAGGELNATETITLTGGSTFNFVGGTLHATSFSGSLTNQGGTLEPGFSAGTLILSGNYTQMSGGDLLVELAGLASFDRLEVSGNVLLDGNLAVELIEGYTLSPDASFEVVNVGGMRTGEFGGFSEGALVGTFGGVDLFITYFAGDGNDIALYTASDLLTGDYNGDGKVNAADFTVWRQSLGAATLLNRDPANSGPVDADDFESWKANYGNSLDGSGTSASLAVPEPATVCLLLLSLLPVGIAARRG